MGGGFAVGCVPVLRICGLRCAGLSSLFCLTCVVLGLVDWIFGLLVALVVGLSLLICVAVVGGVDSGSSGVGLLVVFDGVWIGYCLLMVGLVTGFA